MRNSFGARKLVLVAFLISLLITGCHSNTQPAETPRAPETTAVSPSSPSPSTDDTIIDPTPPTPVTTDPTLPPQVTPSPEPPPATETPVAPNDDPPVTETPAPKTKKIALTFDDGPSPYTDAVLKVLDKHGVKATFFVVGNQVAGNEPMLENLISSGMSVQSHSWRHADLTGLSTAALQEDLEQSENAIEAVTGEEVSCVRPPYGATNQNVRKVVSGRADQVFLWDIDPQDWALPGSGNIVGNVKTYHYDGGVILLHDGGGKRDQTVAALEEVIVFLKKQDYEFILPCG